MKKTNAVKTIMRQGDVLIIRTADRDVKGLKRVAREQGRVVLAHGEVTGHAHAIADKECSLYLDDSVKSAPDAMGMIARIGGNLIPDRVLKVTRAVTLRHEEHGPIALPKGTYTVRLQREYSPTELRNVAD